MILLIDITPINFIKTVSKVYMERQKRTDNTMLKKKNTVEGLILLNVKTYYKAIVMKTD